MEGRERRSTAGKRKHETDFLYGEVEMDDGSHPAEAKKAKKGGVAPASTSAGAGHGAAAPPEAVIEGDKFDEAAAKIFSLEKTARLNKSEARATFHLSSQDLDPLHFTTKSKGYWASPFKMYLISDLEAACLRRFGSVEGLAKFLRRAARAVVRENAKRQAVWDAEELANLCHRCKHPFADKKMETKKCYWGCSRCCLQNKNYRGTTYETAKGMCTYCY